MIRVHVICEGQTEETFINQVLSSYFHSKNIFLIPALIGKPGHKGGNINYNRIFFDVRNRLLGDQSAYCTTFFDFYGLPNDFPGKKEADKKTSINEKANCIQQAILDKLEKNIDPKHFVRLIPYVQMFEFEGLLFSDPEKFAVGIYQDSLMVDFREIRNQFSSPEEINDSPITAPSKRIKSLFPGYDKPIHGSLAAIEIGIGILCNECNLFDGWVRQLQGLSSIT